MLNLCLNLFSPNRIPSRWTSAQPVCIFCILGEDSIYRLFWISVLLHLNPPLFNSSSNLFARVSFNSSSISLKPASTKYFQSISMIFRQLFLHSLVHNVSFVCNCFNYFTTVVPLSVRLSDQFGAFTGLHQGH